MSLREVQTLAVSEGEDGTRLDRWFKRRWPHLNHVQIQKLTRSGQIRVDGARAKPDTRLAAGAQVRVPPLPDAADVSEQREGLSDREIASAKAMVLYEDEEVLALNKPSGLAVQGGTKTRHHVDRLLSAWGEGVDRPRLVHRLDRDTSGVLILGKTPNAAARLASYFAVRKAQKTYWAIVAGRPDPAEGIIDIPLAKRGQGDREMVEPVAAGAFGAEQAESEYATLAVGDGVAWLALRPHTGRTHQLRAHMKAIGHPILGDPKYNDERSRAAAGGLKLQLHARRLVLPHPSRGNPLMLEAPISPELRAGFVRFGFDETAADAEPFSGYGARRRR